MANVKCGVFARANNEYLDITDANQSAGVDITGDFTIEFNQKFTSVPSGGANYKLYERTVGNGIELNYFDASGTLTFQLKSGGSGGNIAHTLTAGTGYHIAVAYTDSTTSYELVIDGVSIGSSAGVASPSTEVMEFIG